MTTGTTVLPFFLRLQRWWCLWSWYKNVWTKTRLSLKTCLGQLNPYCELESSLVHLCCWRKRNEAKYVRALIRPGPRRECCKYGEAGRHQPIRLEWCARQEERLYVYSALVGQRAFCRCSDWLWLSATLPHGSAAHIRDNDLCPYTLYMKHA